MWGQGWVGNNICHLPAWRQGQMLRARCTDSGMTLVGAAMALPAFLIGVTFSIALNRHDERRALMLVEANAIGTACLRAQMLPAPAAMERP